jgi:hypothetical protein
MGTRLSALLVLLCGTLLLSGCNEPYETAPFKGQLLLNDVPVANAQITLQPIASDPNSTKAGPGSYARTDALGMFEMRLVTDDQPGAIVGQHKLFISTGHVDAVTTDAGELKGETIPLRYTQGLETIIVSAAGNENAKIGIISDD